MIYWETPRDHDSIHDQGERLSCNAFVTEVRRLIQDGQVILTELERCCVPLSQANNEKNS